MHSVVLRDPPINQVNVSLGSFGKVRVVGHHDNGRTVRMNILGLDDIDPTPEQLQMMKAQVGKAMQDGALGLTSALIYAPGTYAETEELIELAKVAGQHGGIYTAHIRSEANQFIEAIDETLRIGREGNLPVKIHHLKAGGQPNWAKMDIAIAKIEALRDEGIPVTADMYTYVAGATGLDASMPTWVQAGGYEKWAERLKDGIPKSMLAEEDARKKAESGKAAFVPISLKASPVEIELPNGGIVRLPLGVGQVVLVEAIRAVGALKPWKAPKS